MEGICEMCGLPKNLCVCGEISKETQKIKIRAVKRRFGKMVTLVMGVEDVKEAKELAKALKRKLACGGTTRGTEIELQGEHLKRVKEVLLQEGYKEELIDA
ncbi:MAG: stress response translation initiation inhibitor YciH [Candidatus Diapherotrites archaeon]|uniref:Protein translation factor SUI1 homolog n=1 Tax=Candidatus Iainarchaeum sp. TaxID=3101447 RepID=A0A7J4IS98_9ARCH|nr:stress response translation initiation inhibitor YciH [Candidatus Diapherotrites archaeon]HIH08332.1 stress response translation initiation inhibitor YciH [Candidatus Diapherotrites archaeon]